MSLFSNPRSIAGASAALLLGLSACGGEETPLTSAADNQAMVDVVQEPRVHHRERPPVVVIGVDGLTWNVMEPLFAQGKMPNFRALTERGIAGNLFTDRPTFSPMLWTSIATGVKVKDHGIHYFLESSLEGKIKDGALPYTSNSRKVPAIWNMAGEGGRTVDSVAWWVSWPAEHVPGSRIVASYAAQAQATLLWKPMVMKDGLPELTYPESLQDDISDLLYEGRPDGPVLQEYNARFGTVNPDWKFAFERDRFFRLVYNADRTHKEIFKQMMQDDGPADLNLVYFGIPDVSGHYFWRYRSPQNYAYEVPEEHVERLGAHIDKAYEEMDVWLGEILETLPENAIIMVASDHGMGPMNLEKPNAIQSGGHEDAQPGVLILAGPGVNNFGLQARGKNRTLGSIYDIAPTILDLLDLPSGSYMEGRPLRALMTEDWQAQHPMPAPKDWREGYREATRPLIPMEGANDQFFAGLSAVGYALGDADEEDSSTADGK